MSVFTYTCCTPGCTRTTPGPVEHCIECVREEARIEADRSARDQGRRQHEREARQKAWERRACSTCGESIFRVAKLCHFCKTPLEDWAQEKAAFEREKELSQRWNVSPWNVAKEAQNRKALCQKHGCTDAQLDAVIAKKKEEKRARERDRKAAEQARIQESNKEIQKEREEAHAKGMLIGIGCFIIAVAVIVYLLTKWMAWVDANL